MKCLPKTGTLLKLSVLPLLIIGMAAGVMPGCGSPPQDGPSEVQEEGKVPAPQAHECDGGPLPGCLVADGGILPDAGSPAEADAGYAPSTPPEIVEAWQSAASTPGGSIVTFRVRAREPREGSLSFSWQLPTGTFQPPVNTGVSSEVTWTAPLCGTGQTSHTFQVTLVHSSGLSSVASFQVLVLCPRWMSATDMSVARHGHTASVLPSGEVLVAGCHAGGACDSAEIYSPATDAWSMAGSMAAARAGHTASVLASGRVLVAGGHNPNGILATAEVHVSGWGPTGSMSVGRTWHTATLLSSGHVLVAGGFGVGGALASVELYDPATGTWSMGASMSKARYGHTATLLSTGQVLVTGGFSSSGVLANAEVYDPNSGTWAEVAPMAAARGYHTASPLPSGGVLVAGGASEGAQSSSASAEVYDPATSTWWVVGAMTAGRAYHAASVLPTGKVLVVGGLAGGSLASAELYDPLTQAWTPAGSLGSARSHLTASRLPTGGVLVVGGHTSSGPRSTVEIFAP